MRFSSQSLAGYLAETRQDIGEMTGCQDIFSLNANVVDPYCEVAAR
jgi:hypothetical protein